MTKIKICGLFRDADIDAVNQAQPDYVGFVFAQSRRQVSFDQARNFRRRLSPSICSVGVFVDEPVSYIVRLLQDDIIDVAQLHGIHSLQGLKDIQKHAKKQVIQAIRVEKASDILDQAASPANFLLLDSGPGGTGKAFDWNLIPSIQKPFFLAGGINLHNLNQALGLNPYAIDISSGAETEGYKDPEKILYLVQRVRSRTLNRTIKPEHRSNKPEHL